MGIEMEVRRVEVAIANHNFVRDYHVWRLFNVPSSTREQFGSRERLEARPQVRCGLSFWAQATEVVRC